MVSKFEAKLDGETLLITMNGEVTGQSQLPNIKTMHARKMLIDLAGLKYINSGGVRNWILWMARAKEILPDATFKFENFPAAFVRQVASIQGFLPPGSSVNSFYVPFFCPTCDHSCEHLFTKQKEIMTKIMTLPCAKCSGTMEIDAVPEHYLEL